MTDFGLIAYIDPGTGGYLISSLVAALSGFIALVAAFVIHFFRHTLAGWIRRLWHKHRKLSVTGALLLLVGIGSWVYSACDTPELPAYDPALSGVAVHDPAKSAGGYNLFEGRLMDMQGNTIKQWSNVHLGILDSNGDYYAQVKEDAPLWGRYTWDDKPIWQANYAIHHQILLTPQGTIITFTKETHEYHGRNVEFDVILELDKNGRELQKFSLWEHLAKFQKYHPKLELDMPPNFLVTEDHRKETSVWGGNYDYYHLNWISLVPRNRREGTNPVFKPGNWIICFRHGSMIFILDRDSKEVLWRAIYKQVEGKLEGPHCPQMRPNGNILVFDNGRYRGWSRLIEIEPVTLKVLWEYRQPNFFTQSQGYVQPLSNGNLFVTETEKGRAFEFTPERELVWEFYHPERQFEPIPVDSKKYGLRREIIIMRRYSKEFIDPLLNENP